MQRSASATSHPALTRGGLDSRLAADRSARLAALGDEVRSGSYDPPIDGVVESLVLALLPHIRARR